MSIQSKFSFESSYSYSKIEETKTRSQIACDKRVAILRNAYKEKVKAKESLEFNLSKNRNVNKKDFIHTW